jgi:beta-phosphoglucomutase family hydrolase
LVNADEENYALTNPLGLPDQVRACLFDLDGVITQTAQVHAQAWKDTFDTFLQARAKATGQPFVAFDIGADYEQFVDGKPRLDGTRSFLESRGIVLPEGAPDDLPGAATIQGLSNDKNDRVLRLLAAGIVVYGGSVRYVRAARARGLRTAVVSSSKNTMAVLSTANLIGLFDVVIDGVVAERQHLAGKPAPDTFLAGAAALPVPAAEAAVFEDAIAGVMAGRAGGFGFVVGVDRVGHGPALAAAGADVVVRDLAELLVGPW